MPRDNHKRPFGIGAIVETPTGRRAKVIGYYTDGRAELRYLGSGIGREYEVALKTDLLRKAPTA